MAKQISAQGSADFDWDALALDGYTKVQRAEYGDRYAQTLTSINEKEVIEGTVIAVTKKEVIINVGYKSEGVVPASEFRYNPELKAGDTVDVFVECQEDKTGQLVISHRTARFA
jgi:small subunit ribosomal protein S1